jgi:glycosyltransferase involved in cell wall biosynthesis
MREGTSETELAGLKQQVKRSEQNVVRVQERLRNHSCEAEETIRQLKAEIERLKVTRFEAKRECHNIKRSLSWKMTWPFRALRGAILALLSKSRSWLSLQRSREQPGAEPLTKASSSCVTGQQREINSPRPLLADLGFENALLNFERNSESVLLVTNEISHTDALVLSGLAAAFRQEYNVIVLVLEGWTLQSEFVSAGQLVIGPLAEEQRTERFLTSLFGELVARTSLKFAVVNSIQSSVALSALWQNDIAAVHLIHEFPGDAQQRAQLRFSAMYSTERIFPSNTVRDAAVAETLDETSKPGLVLPLGVYVPPENCDRTEMDVVGQEETRSIVRSVDWPKDTVIVLGTGCLHLTRGVDLFVACARRVAQMRPKQRFRFLWIDDGCDSQTNANYKANLEDEIGYSNLRETLAILKTDGHVENAYLDSDIVFETSWLNPVPFASIKALCDGKPVVCFESATGLAEHLVDDSLASFGVVPLFDIEEAACRMFRLIEDCEFRRRVGAASRQLAKSRFCLKRYVKEIDTIARQCASRKEQEQVDRAVIAQSNLFDVDFFRSPLGTVNQGDPVKGYVSAFSSGIAPRKAVPGFHPGVYQERNDISGRDPLAHYLDSSCPAGPWKFEVIRPIHNCRALKSLRVALHLHLYYLEGLYDIVEQLRRVRSSMDLLVSVTSPIAAEGARACLREYSQGTIDLRVFDNRGRDLGPLLSGFGQTIPERYDIIGHIHTKKSAGVYSDKSFARQWARFLYANLLADQDVIADTILQSMAADDSIGLVFPDDPYILGWGSNLPYTFDVCVRMGIDVATLPKTSFNFPVGTMFWARTAALRPLFGIGLSWYDYPSEPLPCDGSVLHAIERLLPCVAEKTGFRCVVTHVPGVTR